MEYGDIQLNYVELSYISGISNKHAKTIMCDELGLDKVTTKHYLPVKKIAHNFGKSRSYDKRFDGQNNLMLALKMKSEGYKKHLSDIQAIKRLKFTGGKAVLYKIMSPQQKKHCLQCLQAKHRYMWGVKSMERITSQLEDYVRA